MMVYHGGSNPQNTATVITPGIVRDMNEAVYSHGRYANSAFIDYQFKPFVLWYTGIFARSYTRMRFMGQINLFKPNVQNPTGNNAYTYSVDLLSVCFSIENDF